MDKSELSRTQRFFTRFVDADTAAAMEAHSRAWIVQCPHCGFERSIWDLGGIRYKAHGKSRLGMRCPQCRRVSWHKLYKAENFPTTHVPAWPLIRLIGSLFLVLTILSALLLGIVLKLAGAA